MRSLLRLVADNPPASLVDRAARLILTSPEFSRGQKFKRPFEFTVSFLRQTQAECQAPDPAFLAAYTVLGQPLFERGYPDRREDWTHTMSLRFDLATRMVDGHFPSIRIEGARDKLRALAMSPEFQLR